MRLFQTLKLLLIYMKFYLTLILILVVSAFRIDNKSSFSIEIHYLELPNTTHSHYFVTDRYITVKKYVNAIPGRPRLVFDSVTFEVLNLNSISNVVFNTDWKMTRKVHRNHCIDGSLLDINILTLQDTFHFNYHCAHHPNIDKLLRVCNSLIPSSKYRNRYRLVKNDEPTKESEYGEN